MSALQSMEQIREGQKLNLKGEMKDIHHFLIFVTFSALLNNLRNIGSQNIGYSFGRLSGQLHMLP